MASNYDMHLLPGYDYLQLHKLFVLEAKIMATYFGPLQEL
jgi:hypothetical protein